MNIINRMRETIRRRRNMNATIRSLELLTDAELMDIGITRGEINSVARGIIDFHRTVRDYNDEVE